MQVKFIDYKKDYLRFKREYDAAWESINMRGDLILRKDIEEFLQRPVFLNLHVKVKSNWREKEAWLKRFGYS